MLPADFELLKKVMGMTGSDQDGEALSAVRTANKILKSHKKNWEDVFNSKIFVVQPPRPVEPKTKRGDPELEKAFIDLLFRINKTSTFYKFVQNMQKVWLERGSLTPRQRNSIVSNANKVRGR